MNMAATVTPRPQARLRDVGLLGSARIQAARELLMRRRYVVSSVRMISALETRSIEVPAIALAT